MAFIADNKYLDSARLRNIAIQKQLQVKLEQLRHDADIAQSRITKRQGYLRGKLSEMRIENGLQQQQQSDQSNLAKSMLESKGMRRGVRSASTKRRAKSASPSVTLEQFDERLHQWQRERTAYERQSCCLHVDPRYGTPCFVPNVETAYLSGGFHLSLYQ